MPVTTLELRLTDLVGRGIADGSTWLFPSGTVGNGNLYRYVVLHNDDTGGNTLSAVKAWVTLDSGGGTFAIALGDATPRAEADGIWSGDGLPDPAGLTYSSPTTKAAGLTLPNIAAHYKVLLALRRNLASATPDNSETNRLNIAGTSPL